MNKILECWRRPWLVAATSLGLVSVAPGLGAQTTVYEVGACGTYVDIQDAIDAAVVGNDTEIRVQGDSTYQENLVFPKAFTAGSIWLTGGWDCDFTGSSADPGATVVDGGGAGSVARIRIGGGELYIADFTLTHGQAEKGAGIQILLDGDAGVVLESLRVLDNVASSPGSVLGGGLSADLDGFESLELRDLVVQNNLATSSGQAAVYGGGLAIVGAYSARFLIEDSVVSGNRIESTGGNVLGGGVHVETLHSAQGELRDSQVFDNVASGDLEIATGVFARSSQSSTLEIERVDLRLNNSDSAGAGPQIRASAHNISTLWIRDSGVSQGDFRGVHARALDGGQIHLTNLTVAENAEIGLNLLLYELGELSLYNTISFDNGTDAVVAAGVDVGSNLIGVDPLFVDISIHDYHLQAGSSAVDAGDNEPPGGLGTLDLDGEPRIMDGVVDIGMYEREGRVTLFLDGFESGDCSAWSLEVP